MRCGQCGAENPADKRFCGDCGAPLSLVCPACGAVAPLGQRFCGDCGTPLAPGAPPPAGGTSVAASVAVPADRTVAERRMCSVLFVDLVSFTHTSESRDPEEVRELLSRYFELATTVVGRYGGTIEKFIGDAVMAVWGTPVATESDAERAVRAALDLVESVHHLGVDAGIPGLAARGGVLTGEVAVTIGATNEGMVAGDAVNTASRIQSEALGGTVLVDTATKRLTSSAISYADEGDHVLKGKTEPEHLWRAAQVVSAIGGAQRVDGLEAPLVGRSSELRAIREMFHATAERRQPRLMLITGPAGVGKSRLGWEFEKYVDGLVTPTLWHRGRCLSYGDGLVYWALAEVVRQRLGIAEDDDRAVAGTRLAEGLERWVPSPDEREFVGLRLGRLLGVPTAHDTGAPLGRDDLFAGWRRFFEHLAAVSQVVILLEDLHHAAPDLLDFVDHLVDWTRDLPVFVLGFTRPELDAMRPGFATGRNRATISLDPLDPAAMDQIVDHLVPGMPDEAQRQIVERAEGIPLYALESIRSLIDRDVIQPVDGVYRLVGGAAALGDLEVPDSLHALLQARLDALDTVARRVVCDASVLGASFPPEAITAVSGLDDDETGRVLAELLRREVFTVSADKLSPERGNYSFAQEMLRHVAYETLSRRDRKARHLAVAQHLRGTFANDGEDVIDAVARHYQDALDAVPDDPDVPEIRDLLVAALVRAAERAGGSGAPARASAAYAQAAELVAPEDQHRAAELFLAAADRCSWTRSSGQVVELARRAQALAEAIGDPVLVARAKKWAGSALRRQGRHSESRVLLHEALDVLRPERNRDALDALESLVSLETFAGTPEAQPLLLELFDLGNALGVENARFATMLGSRAIYYDSLGQRRLSEMYFREAIRYGEIAGPSHELAQAYLNLGNLLNVDQPHASIEATTRSLAVAQQTGGTFIIGTALTNLAMSHLLLDDWDPADEALFRHPVLDNVADDDWVLVARVQLLALRGDVEGAQREFAHLSEGFLASEDPQDRSSLASARAFLAVAEDDPEEALDQALACTAILGSGTTSFAGDDGRLTWPLAARLADHLGRHDVEADLLSLYEAQPKGAVAPLQTAEAGLMRARLAAAQRDPRAAELFERAIGTMRLVSPPFLLAHGLLDQAEHLGGGEDLLAESLVIADRLRCVPLRMRAEAVSGIAQTLVRVERR